MPEDPLIRELKIAVMDGLRGRDPEPSIIRVIDGLQAWMDVRRARDTPSDTALVSVFSEFFAPTIDALVEGRYEDADRLLRAITEGE